MMTTLCLFLLAAGYLSQVQDLMKKSRGCELPGTFNPLIIGDLFRDQCRPWERIVAHTQDTIVKAVSRMARMILESMAIPEVVNGISARLNKTIERLATNATVKNEEMLRPHLGGHAITYNYHVN